MLYTPHWEEFNCVFQTQSHDVIKLDWALLVLNSDLNLISRKCCISSLCDTRSPTQ